MVKVNTPSPEMPSYMETLRESPFLTTLDRAYRQKCRELEDAERQVALLRAEAEALRTKLHIVRNQLADARRRLDLWRIRHKTWVEERRELLRAAR
jgi:chromosome segregation ATPase